MLVLERHVEEAAVVVGVDNRDCCAHRGTVVRRAFLPIDFGVGRAVREACAVAYLLSPFQPLGVGHIFRAHGERLLVVVGSRLRHIVLPAVLIGREQGRLGLAPQFHGVVEAHAQAAFIVPRQARAESVRQVVAVGSHERVGGS